MLCRAARGPLAAIALLLALASPARAVDYHHPDRARGENPLVGTPEFFTFALVRGGPSAALPKALLYARYRPGDQFEELKVHLTQGSWASGLTRVVRSRTVAGSDYNIIAADMAVNPAGPHAIAWSEAGGTPVMVRYYVSFSSDGGNSWSAPAEIGHYESSVGYAVAMDLDVAASDNGTLNLLLHFDPWRGTGFEVLGSPTTASLELVRYTPALVVSHVPVVMAGEPEPESYTVTAQHFIDLVGGPAGQVAALYAQEGRPKVWTYDGTTSFVREVPDSVMTEGTYPRGTRTRSGMAVRVPGGVFDMPWNNGPAVRRVRHNDFWEYWASANATTDSLASPWILEPHMGTDPAYRMLEPTGNVLAPMPVTDTVMDSLGNPVPRALFDDAGFPLEYNMRDAAAVDGFQKPVVGPIAAMIGPHYTQPTILRMQTWNGTVHKDYYEEVLVSEHVSGTVDVASSPPRATVWLAPPAPNPARHGASLTLMLPTPGMTQVDIIDVQGRRVARPIARMLGAGWHRVRWDGQASDGHVLPSGVYLVRLLVNGVAASPTRRLVVLR